MKEAPPIDVVIAWVDGKDPKHKKKLQAYLNPDISSRDDIAAPTRFDSQDEILFCVASIYRYAPFVRKIFIVTDEQDPQIDSFVRKNFPEQPIPIEIIDHKIIFRDYEHCLPIFNSLAIATALFRIPDLSEHFVYFNDDVFLFQPVKPTVWFDQGKVIVRARWKEKDTTLNNPPGTSLQFDHFMSNAAKLLGYDDRLLHLKHTPHPMLKSVFENYYSEHPKQFEANISHRFRHESQYSAAELFYLLCFRQGIAVSKRGREVYIKAVNRNQHYLKRKLWMLRLKHPLWACVQSLDMASEADRLTIINWLKHRLRINC